MKGTRANPWIVAGLTVLMLLAMGGSCLLAEFFQHLTFRTPLFTWSPYAAGVFGLFGVFLILAGIIRPLREHLKRVFFV